MDPKTQQRWLVCIGLLGAVAVGLGALGAHGLEPWLKSQTDILPEVAARRLENFKLAAQYQLWHTIALLASVALPLRGSFHRWCWLLGIALFCGCLYGYAVTGAKFWVHVVPVGGVSFIVGWAALMRTTLASSPAVSTKNPDRAFDS